MIGTTHLKRGLVGLAIAGTVFGGVYGLAASLGVSPDTLGAGTSVVAACQAGAVSVSYTATYSASPAGYQATTLTLGNLDTSATGCRGKAVKVTLSGAGNASLGEFTGTVGSSGSTLDITATGISASSVTGVAVLIAG